MAEPQDILDLIKSFLKRCADSAMILEKLNNYLLALRRQILLQNLV